MPLVDFRCDACGVTHEVFAASPVADTVACPACGGAARRQYGMGGLLGVRPARRARDRLDRERATRTPMDAAARQRLRDHQHGHDHDHDHGHDHGHGHPHHAGDQGATIKEEEQ
jgi:putative FmdB family regulatory protein